MEKPPVLLPKEISFQLTRDLMKRRARCYISRTSYRAVSALCIIAALFGLVGFFIDPDPHRHALHRLLMFIPLWPAVLYGRWYLRLSKIRHDDINRRVTVRIDSTGLIADYGDTTTTLRWLAIKRLWKFTDIYLLFMDARHPVFITLPIKGIADDTRIFIETKIREHGGQVA